MPRSPDTHRELITQICLCGFEHGLGIHDFSPTWPCLIIKVLVAPAKFLQPSSYCIVINCAFTFCRTTNILVFFRDVMAQFKFVKQIFPNQTILRVHLCEFQIMHGVKQCTTWQSIDYYDLTNHNGYLPRLELLRSRYTHHKLLVIYKALCFDVAQGRMNGAPNETRTHSCRFASLVC